MKKSFLLGGIFVLSLWGTSCQQPAATADYRIVPCPQQIDTTANKGESFVLNSRTKIVYPEGNEKWDETHSSCPNTSAKWCI